MRTVDPKLWIKTIKKPPLGLSRPLKVGVTRSVFEVRLRQSLSDAMSEWLKHSSIEGIKFIIDRRNHMLIRWLYLILLTGTLACGVALVGLKCVSLQQEPPLITNELMLQHTLQHVAFPAVGICSYNVISRTALDKYAKYLFLLDKNRTYTLAIIKQSLRAFGAVLTKTVVPFDKSFMRFLADVAKETNVTNIIFKLSPKCSSLLVRCAWRARAVACERLFAARATTLGFCCIFNSRYYPEDAENAPYTLNSLGVEAGLSVAIREDISDTEYLRRPSNGFEVILFEGTEYPLVAAGGVRAYPAMRNATLLMRLRSRVYYAAAELRHYSDESRGCRWGAAGADAGSWSHCLARCHAAAAEALCGCAPYTLPARAAAAGCSPEHLFCLAKHREKFLYFYPGEAAAADEGLSEEVANGLECASARCQPACARRQPAAACELAPLGAGAARHSEFRKGLNLVNTSVIHLFYTADNQRLYLVETNVRWYEAIASLSSQWVFLAAVTVLGVVEVLYHCLVRGAHHFVRWGRGRGRGRLRV